MLGPKQDIMGPYRGTTLLYSEQVDRHEGTDGY
jgi:hypothetical protein